MIVVIRPGSPEGAARADTGHGITGLIRLLEFAASFAAFEEELR